MSTKNKTRTKDKYRVVYNDTQRIELENEFRLNEYIAIPRKQEIAQKLQLSERQIKIWFQNRRAKKRKQQKRKQLSAVASVTTSSSLGHHHNHNNNHHHHHPHNQQPQQQSSNRSSSDELTRSSISDISSFQHQYQLEGHHLHHNHLNHHPQQPQLISNCGQSVVGYHQNDQLIQQHVSGGGNNENMNSNFELSHQQQQQQQQQQSNLKTTLTTSSGDSPTSSSSLFPIGSSNSTTTGASGDVCDERTNNDQFNETFHENNKLANDTDTAQSSGATANDSNQTALSGQSVIVSNPRLVSTQQQLHHNQPVNQMGACSASTSPTNNTLPPSVDNKREPGSPNSLQTTTATKLNQDKVTSPNPMQHQPARQFYQHQLGRAQAVTTAAAAVAQQLATGNFYDPIYADQVQQPAAYYAGQQQHSTHPQPHHPHPHPHPHHHPHHHQQHLQSQSGGDSAAFHHGHQQHHNLRQHQLMSSPISGLPTNATNQTSSQLVESCWPHEPASVDVGPGAAVAAATTQSSQPPAGVSQTSISHNHTSSSTPSSSQSTSPAMLNHNGNGNNNNNNHSHHQYHNNHHQFHLGSLPHLAAARAHHAAAAASLPMPSPYIQAASGPHHPVANNATAPANYSITNGYHPNNHPQHPHHHHHHHHHPSHHNNNHSHHQFMIEQHYANSVASAGSTEVAVGGGDQHLTQSLASARPTCSPGEQNHHLTIGSLENSYYYNKATLEASAIHRGSNPLIGKHAIYH